MQLNSVEELIEDIRQGRMVILMDDEDRENEGDLVMAAEHVASSVLHMASLPLDANVQFMTVMATTMPYIGRG